MQLDVHCEQCTTFQGKVSHLPSPSHHRHIGGQCARAVNRTLFCRVCVVENAPIHAALQASACTRRSTADVIPHVPGVLLYRIGSLPGLEFANEARLTGQQAPETHRFLPPKGLGVQAHITMLNSLMWAMGIGLGS